MTVEYAGFEVSRTDPAIYKGLAVLYTDCNARDPEADFRLSNFRQVQLASDQNIEMMEVWVKSAVLAVNEVHPSSEQMKRVLHCDGRYPPPYLLVY